MLLEICSVIYCQGCHFAGTVFVVKCDHRTGAVYSVQQTGSTDAGNRQNMESQSMDAHPRKGAGNTQPFLGA